MEINEKRKNRDIPGSPVVKTLPSNTGGAGSISGWGARMPHGLWPKDQNRSNNKINKDFFFFK